MKRFVTPLIVLALVAGLLPGFLTPPAASAAPAADLAVLASFFPTNAPFFAALRIDNGHIETLNSLLNALATHLPDGTLLPDSLRGGLDAAIQQHFPDGSFAETVDPWLGDFAAVGVTTFAALTDDDPTNDSELPSAVIAQITDRDGAEAFFEPIMAPSVDAGYFELRKTADFTLYESPDPSIPIRLMITDDLLVLALAGLNPVVTPRIASLDSNATFQRGLAALPASDYNIVFYLGGDGLAAFQSLQSDLPATLQPAAALAGWAGVMVGLTILDGGTLTIDTVTLADAETSTAMEAMLEGGGAIAPAFDAFLPGDAQFVFRGTNLRDGLGALVEVIRASEPEAADADLNEVATNIREGIQQTFGLDADEDIVSWLTGDYGVILSLSPALIELFGMTGDGEMPSLDRFPFDLSLVVEAVDPEKAQALVAALSDQLPALLAQDPNTDATLTLETIGGHSTIVVSIPVEGGDITIPPLEILIGTSEDVFAVGTRPIVTAALAPDDSLAGQTAYARARSYTLPGAVSFGYISGTGIQRLGDLFVGAYVAAPMIGGTFTNIEGGLMGTLTPEQQAEQERQQEAQRQQAMQAAQLVQTQVQAVVSLIESVTISTAPGGDGVYLQRFTLTLVP